MAEQQDIDLSSMSQEELESFINNAGQQVEETTTQEPEQEAEDDTTQEAEPLPESEPESDPVEDVTDSPEEQPAADEIPEHYRGKSAKELVDIIENQKKYESRRGVEIGQLRSELNTLQANIDKKFDGFTPQTKAEKKDFVESLTEEYGYDKKDVDIIAKLVEHKAKEIIDQRDQEKEQQKLAKSQEVRKSNQALWDNIKDFYDNYQEIEEAMIAEIQKDPSSTLNRTGWVKSFVKSYTQTTKKPASKPTVSVNGAKQRIAKTTTVKAASRPSGNTPKKEDLNSNDPQVYRSAWNYFNPNAQI